MFLLRTWLQKIGISAAETLIGRIAPIYGILELRGMALLETEITNERPMS
jgi:hypothetical protein